MIDNRIPNIKEFFILVISFIVIYTWYQNIIQTAHHNASMNIPDDYLMIEGYVVAKEFGKLRVANEPVNIRDGLMGIITSDYNQEVIIVQSHRSTNPNILKGFSYNQKVRIYGDIIKESSPPSISAYYIEKLE